MNACVIVRSFACLIVRSFGLFECWLFLRLFVSFFLCCVVGLVGWEGQGRERAKRKEGRTGFIECKLDNQVKGSRPPRNRVQRGANNIWNIWENQHMKTEMHGSNKGIKGKGEWSASSSS